MSQINLMNTHTTPQSLASLNLKEHYKPPAGPYKLPDGVETVSEEDIAKAPPVGTFYTRPFMSSQDRRATFEIATADGDTVTLTYERSEVMNSYLHVEGSYVPGLPITNTSEDTFSMTVEGDLDEQEQADIAAFQEEVRSIVEDYLSRRTTGFEEAEDLDMSRYESLTDYAMALDFAASTSYASGMVMGYNPATQVMTQPAAPGKEVSESRASLSVQNAQPLRYTYNDQGSTVSRSNDPEIKSAAAKYSELGKATEKVFEEVNASTESDAYSEALGLLNLDFSGLIEKLTDMFEDPDQLKHYFDNWA
ncbi:MAG: hypothetical protein MI863_02600 [Desulfobacterales bacterium]|nr:hypothetical protein [Desulfobacterales bacterium]